MIKTYHTFGVKLAASQLKIGDCPVLFAPKYADRLARLQEIVIEAPAIG